MSAAVLWTAAKCRVGSRASIVNDIKMLSSPGATMEVTVSLQTPADTDLKFVFPDLHLSLHFLASHFADHV